MTPEQFREHFPMLARTVHLASCSLGARSAELDAALAAMTGAMAEQCAPWPEFEQQVQGARQGFADLIGARPDQIALLPNTSVAAYQIASTMDWPRRPEVVTSIAEFPSIAYVWLAQRPRGADVVYVREQDGLSVAGYQAAISERTGLVSIPMTTFRESVRMPVAEVASTAHAAGARVFVDAYQAAGVEPIDVDALGCDYLVSGTMKYLLGLPGLAFLYVRSAAQDPPPQLTGWFGRTDPFAFDPCLLDYPDHARRYETGTPSVPTAYAANAGLGLIAQLDPYEVRRHISRLVDRATQLLTSQGEQLLTAADPAARGAHIAVCDPDPKALAGWLADRRIVISPRGDVGRLAFHYYNNLEEVYAVCEEIERYRKSAR